MLFGKEKKDMPAAPANDGVIFDVGTRDFEDRVMRASMAAPILVDFWAPWCGPCKQLTPIIEAAVREAGGKIALAKVNIDENPELAQALRVQSVPMVFAFFQGQPVTGFVGVKSKAEIAALIAQLVKMAGQAAPGAIDVPQTLSQAALALSEGQIEAAQTLYMDVLAQDETSAPAYAGLIRCFIAAGQAEHAQEMVAQVPDAIAKSAEFAAARTALELAGKAGSADDLAALQQTVAREPANYQARYDLAEGLFAAGRREEAIDELIEIIRRNRKWEDDKARVQLLKYFEALGFADPLAVAGRRKLSSVLFS